MEHGHNTQHHRESDSADTGIETRVNRPFTVTWQYPEVDAPSALEAALAIEKHLTGLFYRPVLTVTGEDGGVTTVDLDALVESDGGPQGNPITSATGPRPRRSQPQVPELPALYVDKRQRSHPLVGQHLSNYDGGDGSVPTQLGITCTDIADAHGGHSFGLVDDPASIPDDASCVRSDGTVLNAAQMRYLAVQHQLLHGGVDNAYCTYEDERGYAEEYYGSEDFYEIFGCVFGGYTDYAEDRSVSLLVLLERDTVDSLDGPVMVGVNAGGRIVWVRESDEVV